jgi:hypothetical protein
LGGGPFSGDPQDLEYLRRAGLISPRAGSARLHWTAAGDQIARFLECGLYLGEREPKNPGLFEYYARLFGGIQRVLLLPGERRSSGPKAEQIGALLSAERVRAFLDRTEAAPGRHGRLNGTIAPGAAGPPFGESLRLAQAWLRRLIEAEGPITFASLVEGAEPGAAGDAARMLICHSLAFFALVDARRGPALWLHPMTRRGVRYGKPDVPATVPASSPACDPWLLTDVVLLLAAAAAKPLALRAADGMPRESRQKELTAAMIDFPHLIPQQTPEARAHHRIVEALSLAMEQDLVEVNPSDRVAKLSRAGAEFLAMPRAKQWGLLADWRRVPQLPAPAPARRPGLHLSSGRGVDFDALAELAVFAAALRELPEDGLVPMTPWLRSFGERRNPMLERAPSAKSGGDALPTEWELVFELEGLLFDIAFRLLSPLGGLRVEKRPEGVCIGVTPVGRYLLRASDRFEPPPETPAAVVIQPNFEAVFMGGNPAAEAALMPFAERIGRGVGSLFRFTRKSVTRAAECGLTAEQAVEAMRRATDRPLPENVVHEVKGWMSRVRRVRLGEIRVLRCPDAETAARVKDIIGPGATAITDLILEVTIGSPNAAQKRALEKAGIFIEQEEVFTPELDEDEMAEWEEL